MILNLRKKLSSVKILREIKRSVEYKFWKQSIKRDTKNILKEGYDADKTYWIDTARINKYFIDASKEEHPINEIGQIKSGEWDRNTADFVKLDVFESFVEHFIDGVNWEETKFYKRVLADIENGMVRWGCSTKDHLIGRFNNFDHLYEEIKEKGYKTQKELAVSDPDKIETIYDQADEIRVHITRDGEYLFADGRHRFSIAKILGLKKIPVKVSRRHRKWVDFRSEILAYANDIGGKTYQPILHPDLKDISSFHDHTRWELIRECVKDLKGTVLDVGANWGYFSHQFESEGFHCIAVELMPRDLYFLNKLHDVEKKKFETVSGTILDYYPERDINIVLALNIFHHFLKTKDDYEKLIKLLSRLKCEMIFFQPHLASEPQMKNAYKNMDEENYLKFIKEHTGLNNSTQLGNDADGRALYVIYGRDG